MMRKDSVSRDKKTLYAISLLLLAALLSILFFEGTNSRVVTTILLIPFAVAVFFFIRKRSILSINKRQVLLLMSVIGLVYVMLFYLTGLHFGFSRTVGFSASSLMRYSLPIMASIIAIEIIRTVLLAQNNKAIAVISYFFCILVDILVQSSFHRIDTFNQFMDFMGFTLMPALVANFLYHYVAKRYGATPNIVYRLIITLYPYLLPFGSAVPDSIVAFMRLVVPLLVYLFLHALYETKRYHKSSKSKIWSGVGTAFAAVVMISIVLLISNQFRYGTLVIATESMTGEINKGDAIVYEKYDDQSIAVDQVIVFEKNNSHLVHRVVKVESINGETRYYTKGDANEDMDTGYITDVDIVGVTKFKLPFVGYPTIWLRELFAEKIRGG